jgi:mRNA-degrading endonuclease RelE of RelBE toxin-antitoxin system
MVIVSYSPNFTKIIRKIKDGTLKEKVKTQIRKLLSNPEAGKPMKYSRKGTRELYLASFRLSYAYLKEEGKIILLDLYHKDKQ